MWRREEQPPLLTRPAHPLPMLTSLTVCPFVLIARLV